MTDTANHLVPGHGDFVVRSRPSSPGCRRWNTPLRLHSRSHRTLGTGGGSTKGGAAPKPRSGPRRCSRRCNITSFMLHSLFCEKTARRDQSGLSKATLLQFDEGHYYTSKGDKNSNSDFEMDGRSSAAKAPRSLVRVQTCKLREQAGETARNQTSVATKIIAAAVDSTTGQPVRKSRISNGPHP